MVRRLLISLLVLGAVQTAQAQTMLRVTEAMSSGGTPDWFELTNISESPINISGFKVDDNSFNFANAVILQGVSEIAPGERVVFVESATNYLNSFQTFWGSNNLQVGNYSGSGIGLSSGGDGVIIFDASGIEVTRVSFGPATAGKSFYWGYDNVGNFNASYVGASNAGLVSALGTLEGQVTYTSTDVAGNWASPGTSIVTCNTLNTYFQDLDNDGYGNVEITTDACIAPNGYVSNFDDCDDNNADLNAGAIEICNGIDDNCDGESDEYVMNTYYIDADQDGFGNLNEMILSCDLPAGYVINADDCDDNMILYADIDMDGFGGLVLDGCGVESSTDCDDANDLINPNGVESCNDLDDNCDGSVDENVQSMFYADADLDGYGNMDSPIYACSVSNGVVANSDDCDDNNASVYPSASEVCNLVDDNCNFEVDEFVQVSFYQDLDADGFGNANEMIMSCFVLDGYVSNDQDCDDSVVTYADLDGDGFGSDVVVSCGVFNADDCDDLDANTYPNASELCDALDNNCNGEVDELFGQNMFYADLDQDGFGDLNNVIYACIQPEGTVTNTDDCDDSAVTYEDLDGDGYGNENVVSCGVHLNGDCDDFDGMINPGVSELCNGIDDNCNVEVDEFVLLTFYMDMDGDGFGDANAADFGCELPTGYVLNDSDCDDASIFYADADGDGFGSLTVDACGVDNSADCDDENAQISPEAIELCDGVDQNCNVIVDEDVALTFYADLDMDGFGDLNNAAFGCEAPIGYVDNSLDCDDSVLLYADMDGDGFGGMDLDACGVADNSDCNDEELLYEDMDNDGFGSEVLAACGVDNAIDCDDASSAINPTAIEICNDLDENCNQEVDEGVVNVYYADIDADGFGNQNDVVFACELPAGFVTNADDCDDSMVTYIDGDGDGQGGEIMAACGIASTGDCNDSNASVNENAIEVCNGIDDNCNVEVDEGVGFNYYADADNDGFGNLNVAIVACTMPTGYVDNGFDCDDNMLLYTDLDSDGYGGQNLDACGVVTNTDCLDFDDTVNPGVIEACDNIDQNCNGLVDEGLLISMFQDSDGDSYGNALVIIEACELQNGYVLDSTDCNDVDATINPGATEVADNAIDENCDGQIATTVVENELEVFISPNPASDIVTINTVGLQESKVQVFNMNGQLVFENLMTGSSVKIEVSGYSNGLYLIKIANKKYSLVVSH
jgi:hypothetical protein